MFVITEKRSLWMKTKQKLCVAWILLVISSTGSFVLGANLLFRPYGWSLTFIIAYWLPTVADLTSFGRVFILR